LLIFRYSDWLQAHTPIRFLLLLLMILFMLAVLLFPLLLVLTFFIQGIQVLRREGLRPQNLLSLLFAILLFAYLIFWPQLGDWQSNFAGRTVYAIVGLWIAYGLLLFAIYAISALLNLIHRRDNQNFDYIVVLGAGIRGERATTAGAMCCCGGPPDEGGSRGVCRPERPVCSSSPCCGPGWRSCARCGRWAVSPSGAWPSPWRIPLSCRQASRVCENRDERNEKRVYPYH